TASPRTTRPRCRGGPPCLPLHRVPPEHGRALRSAPAIQAPVDAAREIRNRIPMNLDTDYMQRCFQLAELGRQTCRPNPVVGSVIVAGKQVIGEGWHQVAGESHAE